MYNLSRYSNNTSINILGMGHLGIDQTIIYMVHQNIQILINLCFSIILIYYSQSKYNEA